MSLLLIPLLSYMAAAAVAAGPIFIWARNRVYLRIWEAGAALLPLLVWGTLMFSKWATGKKSLSNAVIEPGILGLALALGLCARVLLSRGTSEKQAAVFTWLGMCGVAASVFWWMPALRE